MLNSCANDDPLFGQTDKDTLWGGDGNGNNIMIGGIGNHLIDGGAGADVMVGGEGYDKVITNTSYLLNANIEELRLLEGFAVHSIGNELNNLIIGNSSYNILDGVNGADNEANYFTKVMVMF